MSLQLFGHPFSSYTWKALIPLYANGTQFEFREYTPFDPVDAEYLQRVHPGAKFPVLVDGDTTVIESTAIIEYLAVHYPGIAPLIPADPAEAVVTRMLDRIFDNYVMANLQRVVSAYIRNAEAPDANEVAGGKQGLLAAYRWIEAWLADNRLPPHVSLVTCAAAPSLFYADWVERIPASCTRLAALRAELLALPPVSRCVEDARPYRKFFPLGAPDRD
jgi:glutathione S-transferase